MSPVTFLQIELEARKAHTNPSEDDYKDAIVEVFADTEHLTDEDIDYLYYIFSEYRSHNPMLGELSNELFENFFEK